MDKFVDIPGYEGLYQINELGIVRSVWRQVVRSDGRRRTFPVKILKQYVNTAGYLSLSLWKNGEQRGHRVHHLLAMTFIPNPKNLPLVRHLNDNKRDNRLENLAWGTQIENMSDLIENGRNFQANKTHCINGHEFTDENTISDSGHIRVCLECKRQRGREYMRRRRSNDE